jgi:hypothetical protein
MTTLDELREVLEHRAGVPDPTGMIEAARTRATHVRRRRRLTAAAAVVAVAAIAVPVTLAQLRTSDPLPAAYRGAGEATVSVQPDPRFFVLSRRIDATGQMLTVRHRDTADRDWGGVVTVHDPGTYDPDWLGSAEAITVSGRPAHLMVTGESVIGWREPSGAWVVVGEAQSVPALRRLAESVRLGPPHEVTSPVRFGSVPDGLRLRSVTASDDPASLVAHTATVSFSTGQGGDPVLTASAYAGRGGAWTELTGTAPQWQTIGGHRAWRVPASNPNFSRDSGAHVLIETPECGVDVSFQPERISYDEVTRVVTGMTIADCTDPATWTPPLK